MAAIDVDTELLDRAKKILPSQYVNSDPTSERAQFTRFVEESGANCTIMEALRKLYDLSVKPDDPIVWLINFFRNLAPKREAEVKEIKAVLREKLMELETTIILLKEEEQTKIAQLNKLFKCARPSSSAGDSLPDPTEYHRKDREQLRIDTKWRLAPDPLFRTTCSDEALKKRWEDIIEVIPEDGYYDYYNSEMYEQEGELEDEEWLQSYNVYKKTSELPKKSSKTVKIEPAVPDNGAEEAEEEEGESEPLNIHPDRLPDNYWLPGFTLHPCRCENELSSAEKADLDVCSKNVDDCYKSSLKDCKYIPRRRRSQIIFENDYDVWKTDFPDEDEEEEDDEEETDNKNQTPGKNMTNDEDLLVPPNTFSDYGIDELTSDFKFI